MRTLLMVMMVAVSPPKPARRGVEQRPAELEKAPQRGLLLQSVGLVNETFKITVDLDTKTIVRVTHFAKDGSEAKTSRTLSTAEVDELTALRDRVWTEWTELERVPSAEYQEHLYLLDGKSTSHIRADSGFRETGSTGALAHRLQSLAAKR